MDADTTPAIACTLDARTYEERVQEIRALFARSLTGARRDGTRLHLTFRSSARRDVEDFVCKEQACCAFLTFTLEPPGETVELTIAAPPDAHDAIDILAMFETGATTSSCACG